MDVYVLTEPSGSVVTLTIVELEGVGVSEVVVVVGVVFDGREEVEEVGGSEVEEFGGVEVPREVVVLACLLSRLSR